MHTQLQNHTNRRHWSLSRNGTV